MYFKRFFFTLLLFCVIHTLSSQTVKIESGEFTFELPEEYLEESNKIPRYWISSNEEVCQYLQENVIKGSVKILGYSAGGRPIWGVFYGKPRSMEGRTTTTFASYQSFTRSRYYDKYNDTFRGVDHNNTVYLGLSGVHGGEFEGIVGTVNLISVIETGKDLRGHEWPEITSALRKIDRLILIPIVNPDGRARIPIRMQKYRGDNRIPHEFLNTGGYPDGSLIGWLKRNETSPMDFSQPGFPGGYPNDAGVNLSLDDFFGDVQPETRVLLDVVKKELPDITINMHTGADYMLFLRSLGEEKLNPIWDSVYTYVRSRLAIEGLLKTDSIELEADPSKVKMGQTFGQNSALNFHSGTLSIVIESPAHGFSRKSGGELAYHTPEMLLNAQLIAHLETIKFLGESGGRSKWDLK